MDQYSSYWLFSFNSKQERSIWYNRYDRNIQFAALLDEEQIMISFVDCQVIPENGKRLGVNEAQNIHSYFKSFKIKKGYSEWNIPNQSEAYSTQTSYLRKRPSQMIENDLIPTLKKINKPSSLLLIPESKGLDNNQHIEQRISVDKIAESVNSNQIMVIEKNKKEAITEENNQQIDKLKMFQKIIQDRNEYERFAKQRLEANLANIPKNPKVSDLADLQYSDLENCEIDVLKKWSTVKSSQKHKNDPTYRKVQPNDCLPFPLYPWQDQFFEVVSEKPFTNNRDFFVIKDHQGNTGKSWLCNWLNMKKGVNLFLNPYLNANNRLLLFNSMYEDHEIETSLRIHLNMLRYRENKEVIDLEKFRLPFKDLETLEAFFLICQYGVIDNENSKEEIGGIACYTLHKDLLELVGKRRERLIIIDVPRELPANMEQCIDIIERATSVIVSTKYQGFSKGEGNLRFVFLANRFNQSLELTKDRYNFYEIKDMKLVSLMKNGNISNPRMSREEFIENIVNLPRHDKRFKERFETSFKNIFIDEEIDPNYFEAILSSKKVTKYNKNNHLITKYMNNKPTEDKKKNPEFFKNKKDNFSNNESENSFDFEGASSIGNKDKYKPYFNDNANSLLLLNPNNPNNPNNNNNNSNSHDRELNQKKGNTKKNEESFKLGKFTLLPKQTFLFASTKCKEIIAGLNEIVLLKIIDKTRKASYIQSNIEMSCLISRIMISFDLFVALLASGRSIQETHQLFFKQIYSKKPLLNLIQTQVSEFFENIILKNKYTFKEIYEALKLWINYLASSFNFESCFESGTKTRNKEFKMHHCQIGYFPCDSKMIDQCNIYSSDFVKQINNNMYSDNKIFFNANFDSNQDDSINWFVKEDKKEKQSSSEGLSSSFSSHSYSEMSSDNSKILDIDSQFENSFEFFDKIIQSNKNYRRCNKNISKVISMLFIQKLNISEEFLSSVKNFILI